LRFKKISRHKVPLQAWNSADGTIPIFAHLCTRFSFLFILNQFFPMKKGLLGGVMFLLLMSATTGCSQNDSKNQGATDKATTAKPAEVPPGGDAPITPDLIRLSEFMKFDYKGTLEKCKKGDEQAIVDFLDFHRIVDGNSSLEHATICLEMIPAASDAVVAKVCKTLKDKLKIMVRDRFVEAQKVTKKPELQKGMSEWAPRTWAALNNQILIDPAREAAKQTQKDVRARENANSKVIATEGSIVKKEKDGQIGTTLLKPAANDDTNLKKDAPAKEGGN